jgi:hypothetical protein
VDKLEVEGYGDQMIPFIKAGLYRPQASGTNTPAKK